MRLTQHLRDLGLTNSQLKQALATGKVAYRGVPTADGGREIDPDEIRYQPNAPRLKPGRDVVLIHRDDDLAVVWKPAGLLSVPARKEGGHKSVMGVVRRILGSALVVHRLDEHTSGLLLVALNEHSQKHLKDQLYEHTVERRYLALVHGQPQRERWTVESELIRDRGDGLRGSRNSEEQPAGKRALTHFQALERLGRNAALVEASLETGRTHQVRIHLAESRYPVLGDPLYSHPRARQAAPRLALHAAVLEFTHPATRARRRFVAPLADDLERLRRSLLSTDRDGQHGTKSRSKPRRPRRAAGKKKRRR
jgi:RluA family pseudouridine synthase